MLDSEASRSLLGWIERAELEYFYEPVEGTPTLAFANSLANGDSSWLVSYESSGLVNIVLIGERDGRGHWRAGFRDTIMAERWLTAEVGFAIRQARSLETPFIPSDEHNLHLGATLRTREDGQGRISTDLVINSEVVAWFASARGAGGAAYSSHLLTLDTTDIQQLFTEPDLPDQFRSPVALPAEMG